MDKITTTVRLTQEAKDIWLALARKRGINQTAVIETLIREAAKRENVKP